VKPIASGMRLALVLSLIVSAACSELTAEPGVTRDAVADVIVRLTRERPTAERTITLRAEPGSLRDRTGASAYVFIHPAPAAKPPVVEVEFRHSATGLQPPDSTGLNEEGELSFTPFTTCSDGGCEEPWHLTITWKEPRDTASLNVQVGIIVSVRYSEGTEVSPDDEITATIE
jgi:hypothetical protein